MDKKIEVTKCINKKQEIIRSHLNCTCDEAYKNRNLTDPNCFLCEYESEIELMMNEYHEQQLKTHNLQSEQLIDFVRWQNTKSNFITIPESIVEDYAAYLEYIGASNYIKY